PLHRALGLTDSELDAIRGTLRRDPNSLELALYGVMWSEHCSYKSSRLHLKRLPTTAPHVLVGPGENAGVIDAGDDIAVAIRIESHNHPSAIEPYQGAATCVGGILRDVFTMGARPLAVMDSLFFGELDEARQRWLVEGVVSGISGYGNSVGVPTVGGELTFDECYRSNPLVNVLCVGAMPKERLVLGVASGVGNLAVLLGSRTGRDGIGGVSVLASAGFSGSDGASSLDDAKRPSVQVGDPYEEKRLIEACLELLDRGYVVGIQDLGGAGLVCATSETAARGRVGMDVDVNAVPLREAGMAPYEIMTSESQERMLAIITPERFEAVQEVCDRWEVRCAVVGRVVEPLALEDGSTLGMLRVRDGFDGEILAEVPAASLADEAPLYDRERRRPANLDAVHADDPDDEPAGDVGEDLLDLLVDPAWVYRQYDTQLFLNTVVGPGRDAALLRLAGPGLPASSRGIALSTDSNPRWCALDPRIGTALTLAEGVANLACVGASAKAVVNCLNFGNPEHPEVMWQLSESIDGMAEACRTLDLPVIGGNVSLYNESGGVDIDPTPVLGLLGVVEHLNAPPPGWAWRAGDAIVLVGSHVAPGENSFPLGGSRWATRRGRRGGRLAHFDPASFREVVDFVVAEVARVVAGETSDLSAVHDVAGGGLGVALAEMAVTSGVGLRVEGIESHHELFSEFVGRFVVATSDVSALLQRAYDHGVAAKVLGHCGGDGFVIDGLVNLELALMRERRSGALEARLHEGV
ncbi:MAG TPA: phosphoribosylformylglycinamidine synthase subunit PurL, partial [Acidimicrobiales bacterium]|nr:phosphoribosylformylglycinamidine synthase subunit PurL [Acidimicrobiales bacterium]